MKKLTFIFVLIAAFLCSGTAQEIESKTNVEVLETLKTQLSHAIAGEYEENAKYIHPRAVFWGDFSTFPIPNSEEIAKLWGLERENSSVEILGFSIVPITVEVVGNTAILNVSVRTLLKPTPDSEPVTRQRLLHNTWIKEKGRWLLLATYNTLIEE